MLNVLMRDETGKLVAGHLYCSSESVRQNWMKRLRKIGLQVLDHNDTQNKHALFVYRNPS